MKQLCREIHRTLSEAFSGVVGDDRVAGLIVDSVAPAPDASRVIVFILLPEGENDPAGLLERLGRLRGVLRAEVAASIQRKRTPELVFQTVRHDPADDDEEGGVS